MTQLAGSTPGVNQDDDAMINAPLQPRLLALHGDGTGVEFLRDDDVRALQRTEPLDPATIVEGPRPCRPPYAFDASGQEEGRHDAADVVDDVDATRMVYTYVTRLTDPSADEAARWT